MIANCNSSNTCEEGYSNSKVSLRPHQVHCAAGTEPQSAEFPPRKTLATGFSTVLSMTQSCTRILQLMHTTTVTPPLNSLKIKGVPAPGAPMVPTLCCKTSVLDLSYLVTSLFGGGGGDTLVPALSPPPLPPLPPKFSMLHEKSGRARYHKSRDLCHPYEGWSECCHAYKMSKYDDCGGIK